MKYAGRFVALGAALVCSGAVWAQKGETVKIAMTDALPATMNIPRCTSVRRDLVNKPGLPAVAISKASQSDLILVPGISASTAQKIIAERVKREFSDWDDVLRRVDSMRCIDFTGSPLQVMSRPFDAKGLNPKNPGF